MKKNLQDINREVIFNCLFLFRSDLASNLEELAEVEEELDMIVEEEDEELEKSMENMMVERPRKPLDEIKHRTHRYNIQFYRKCHLKKMIYKNSGPAA